MKTSNLHESASVSRYFHYQRAPVPGELTPSHLQGGEDRCTSMVNHGFLSIQVL